jgi:peptidylprolyl isomerase
VLKTVLPLVLALSLAGCGDDSGDGSSSEGPLSAVDISGEPGKAPDVTWDGDFEATEVSSDTVSEGEGDEVASGDKVVAHIWVGNGFDETQAYSTYEEGGPQTLTVDDASLSPVFLDAIEGETIGSRVAVAAPAEEVFGPAGNPQLNIGNKDSLLLVVDLMELYEAPAPKDVPASKMPKVVEKKGDPVSLDFAGVAKPKADGEFMRTVLEEGDGETLTTESTIEADYLGMVHGAKKPFDESYSGKPAEFSLTGVVEGWTYGLSGLKVGSRVLLAIPPDLGYGAQAQSGIPANSTLYFVVDIVSAK